MGMKGIDLRVAFLHLICLVCLAICCYFLTNLSAARFQVALAAAFLGGTSAIVGIALTLYENRAVFVLWLIILCLLILGSVVASLGTMR
jgi:hypothetical protein